MQVFEINGVFQEFVNPSISDLGYLNEEDFKNTIYGEVFSVFSHQNLNNRNFLDFLRTIKDPEKPSTLEDLKVVYEEGIFVQTSTNCNVPVVRVEFNPTVPHCSLATLIGLCIRVKIERNLTHNIKLDIFIKKGAHSTEDEINKQINDKERVGAALENPNLKNLVEDCIKEQD